MTPDSPFSVSEFERVLRPFDRDCPTLPQRLAALAGNVLVQHRAKVTVESYHLACPPAAFLTGVQNLPAEITAGSKMNLNRYFGTGPGQRGQNGQRGYAGRSGPAWPGG